MSLLVDKDDSTSTEDFWVGNNYDSNSGNHLVVNGNQVYQVGDHQWSESLTVNGNLTVTGSFSSRSTINCTTLYCNKINLGGIELYREGNNLMIQLNGANYSGITLNNNKGECNMAYWDGWYYLAMNAPEVRIGQYHFKISGTDVNNVSSDQYKIWGAVWN